MDLLKYLEPMKNLPKRFSNLAFWRDVRKFKDYVVNALEYVNSWGENIEHSLVVPTPFDVLYTSITISDVSSILTSTQVRNEHYLAPHEGTITTSIVFEPSKVSRIKFYVKGVPNPPSQLFDVSDLIQCSYDSGTLSISVAKYDDFNRAYPSLPGASETQYVNPLSLLVLIYYRK